MATTESVFHGYGQRVRTASAISQAVANILREQTEQTFTTQSELAKRTGISQSQISKLLRGERQMSLDQLISLCDALRLSLVDVVAEATRTK